MFKFTILILVSLTYQTMAGGPSVSTTTTSPTSTTAPKCISCVEVFKNGKSLSPLNCDPGTSPKVILTISYVGSKDPPVSGACTGPNAGVTTSDRHASIEDVSVDGGSLLFP